MAQNEDTELRDLVIEALEKNGSLAKVRALLRANVFLAFENECEKLKHNICLDNLLQMPEGVLSLSLVHEFLEHCNLKNTLFVYMSETRQGTDYRYEGKKSLAKKLNFFKHEEKEPLLVTIIKKVSNLYQKKFSDGDNAVSNRDDQNCTYIVHEDSSSASSQSTSQSDQSSDEKNKLHLRLPLDHSDTDTSSESTREKLSSEYIPNKNIVIRDESEDENRSNSSQQSNNAHNPQFEMNHKNNESVLQEQSDQGDFVKDCTYYSHKSDMLTPSSESTSYIDIKSFDKFTYERLNTSGLPDTEKEPKEIKRENDKVLLHQRLENENLDSALVTVDSAASATLSNVTSISSKDLLHLRKSQGDARKSDMNTPEYTYDFTSSSPSKHRATESSQKNLSPELVESPKDTNQNVTIESPHHVSQSSQSSVSISDVADLVELSEVNNYNANQERTKPAHTLPPEKVEQLTQLTCKEPEDKLRSDESGDFSESPIPSLSNLSLDFHSD